MDKDAPRFTKEERTLMWGAGIFIVLVVAVSGLRWYVGSSATPSGGGEAGGADGAPVARRRTPEKIVVTEGRTEGRGSGGGTTLALSPDADPPLPEEDLETFFLVMAGGDFEDIALKGAALFPKGAEIPDPERWFGKFRQDGNTLSNDATYLLYFDRDDKESRRILLIIDLNTRQVRDFVVDVLKMLPPAENAKTPPAAEAGAAPATPAASE